MSIDNIFICARDADLDEVRYPLCSHAREALLELLESCKPEDWELYGDKKSLAYHEALGFNTATQQYHSNIRKLFNDER